VRQECIQQFEGRSARLSVERCGGVPSPWIVSNRIQAALNRFGDVGREGQGERLTAGQDGGAGTVPPTLHADGHWYLRVRGCSSPLLARNRVTVRTTAHHRLGQCKARRLTFLCVRRKLELALRHLFGQSGEIRARSSLVADVVTSCCGPHVIHGLS
jgi:hypothetical protein